MRLRSSSALFLPLLATALLASACSVSVDSVDPGDKPAPSSLADAKIPADFSFASTRGVGIQISVNPKNLPVGVDLPIEIRNTRNELLAAAKPDAQGKLSLDYPLPLADKQLLIKVGDQQQIVDVGPNHSASATFE